MSREGVKRGSRALLFAELCGCVSELFGVLERATATGDTLRARLAVGAVSGRLRQVARAYGVAVPGEAVWPGAADAGVLRRVETRLGWPAGLLDLPITVVTDYLDRETGDAAAPDDVAALTGLPAGYWGPGCRCTTDRAGTISLHGCPRHSDAAPAPAGDTFRCDACGETFPKAWTDQDAAAEADAVYHPDELAGAATVCDPCLDKMRAQMPDLDQRYRTVPAPEEG